MGSPIQKSPAYEQARKTVERICQELCDKYTLFGSTTKIEPYNIGDDVSLRPPQDGPIYIHDANPYFQALLDFEHHYDAESESLGGIERAILKIIPSVLTARYESFMKELQQKFTDNKIPLDILRIAYN